MVEKSQLLTSRARCRPLCPLSASAAATARRRSSGLVRSLHSSSRRSSSQPAGTRCGPAASRSTSIQAWNSTERSTRGNRDSMTLLPKPSGVTSKSTSGVAAPSDHDSTHPALVVAGIEGPPAIAQVALAPGAEVHRVVGRRHPYVREIAEHIPRGDVHGATEGDEQLREVSTHPFALVEG